MKYLLRKHGLYYRPNACGYTDFAYAAGIFREEDCEYELAHPEGEVEAIRIVDITQAQLDEAKSIVSMAQNMIDVALHELALITEPK